VIPTTGGHGHRWGMSNPQERGAYKRDIQGGNYPCILIKTHFLKLLMVYEPSNLWLSVPKTNH